MLIVAFWGIWWISIFKQHMIYFKKEYEKIDSLVIELYFGQKSIKLLQAHSHLPLRKSIFSNQRVMRWVAFFLIHPVVKLEENNDIDDFSSVQRTIKHTTTYNKTCQRASNYITIQLLYVARSWNDRLWVKMGGLYESESFWVSTIT